MKSLTIILTMSIWCIGTTLMAQNTKEIRQDRNQIRIDKALLDRDTKELAVFRVNAEALKTALDNRNDKEVKRLKTKLVASMKRELWQTEAKLHSAKIEVKQSEQEIRTDRRENRRNRRQYTGSDDDHKDIARDRHNTRDDRRDKRDDQRDLEEINRRLTNQRALYERLKITSINVVDKDLKKEINKNIVAKFIATMVADIDETREELREDKREKREDKRERRDDRRERYEKF
ncbi:hypothetical protein [Aquimarina rhabdastrellae]